MMRSMQKAKPSTRANATSDMNEALPSINFSLSILCKPPPEFSAPSAISTGTTAAESASC